MRALNRAELKISVSVARDQGGMSSPVVVHSDRASVDVIYSAICKDREGHGASMEEVHNTPFS